MATTVTIERSYLDTLLRRADYSNGHPKDESQLDSIMISRAEHQHLLKSVREYDRLQQALYRGGISPEILEVLIQGPSNGEDASTPSRPFSPLTDDSHLDEKSHFRHPSVQFTITRPLLGAGGQYSAHDGSLMGTENGIAPPRNSRAVPPGYGPEVNSLAFDTTLDLDLEDSEQHPGYIVTTDRRKTFARQDKRSLFLSNLSDRTTHKDIVAFVRGGPLLDVYLRNDRTASVAFVEGSAAKEFMEYARRNDIYIHDKRVEIRWADRHFILPPHVANKISNGATRNILIRNIHDRITEERVREDLDHIFNLVVVEITFSGHNCLISTNSVHNAMFARTCMMSRSTYRGTQIEWAPDACASPLPAIRARNTNSLSSFSHKGFQSGSGKQKDKQGWSNRGSGSGRKPMPNVNRFNLLNIDGAESDESEKEDQSGAEISLSGHGPNHRWADSGIAA